MKSKRGIIYKRKQYILKELKENGQVLVDDLAKQLQVSQITIRRDLDEFQSEGLVERFYGGATLIEGALSEDPSHDDEDAGEASRPGCKDAIARAAADMVEDGDIIFLNSSSTALQILKYLKNRHVTVVTNNANAIREELDPRVELVLTGGEVTQRKKSLVGDVALQMLHKLRADKCFIGVSGINIAGEITTAVLQETMINSLMIEQSKGCKVILADHTRVGSQNNFVISTLDQVTHVVTDSLTGPELLAGMKRPNLTIVRAEV